MIEVRSWTHLDSVLGYSNWRFRMIKPEHLGQFWMSPSLFLRWPVKLSQLGRWKSLSTRPEACEGRILNGESTFLVANWKYLG